MAEKASWKDRIWAAFGKKDDAALKKTLDEMPDTPVDEGDKTVTIKVIAEPPQAPAESKDGEGDPAPDPMKAVMEALAKIDARLTALEGAKAAADQDDEKDKKETQDGDDEDDDEEDGKTYDAASVAAIAQATLAHAEIVSPGVKLPTFDAKAAPKATMDALCALRRSALAKLADDAPDAARRLAAGIDLKAAPSQAVAATFDAVAELIRADRAGRQFAPANIRASASNGAPLTIADLNKRNREFWASHKAH